MKKTTRINVYVLIDLKKSVKRLLVEVDTSFTVAVIFLFKELLENQQLQQSLIDYVKDRRAITKG